MRKLPPLQLVRGTTEQVAALTPALGEPVWDKEALELRIGDGVTPGGFGLNEKLYATHERLIFKKKFIMNPAMKNPEWDYLLSLGIREYPQAVCLDEASGKILFIGGSSPSRPILVYNWPDGTFDRVFFCTVGSIVSEGAVVRVEGASKFLYMRTSGDVLSKFDITSYPAARATIAPTSSTVGPGGVAVSCGLNLCERNGTWTISDVGNGPLGNVRSRGKFSVTDSTFNATGGIDCGDYLMGIYAGRDGDTSVTKTQGVADTGYGIVAGMGGQWVSPATATPYMQNGLRIFTYDGELVAEGLLRPDLYAAKIAAVWGFTPTVIENEGIFLDKAGNVYSLTITSNNGVSTASDTHGFLITQEFCDDGVDFSDCAAPRLQQLQSRNTPVTTSAGVAIVDPTNPGVAVTTIAGLVVAMQRSGREFWTSYTTGLTLVDMSGTAYQIGCKMTVQMARSDIYYIRIEGFNYYERRRIYNNGTTWIEENTSDPITTQTYAADGPRAGDVALRRISNDVIQLRMRGADLAVRGINVSLDSGFVAPTGLAFLDGFNLTWGASSISVGPGTAFINSTLKHLTSRAAISVPLAGLTTDTLYHLYLYESSGAAAVELVATAPLLSSTGAYIKTGDTSRRYLGSVLASGTTSVYRFIHAGNRMEYAVNVAGVTIFNFSGSAIVATTVSLSGCVPVTAIAASGDLLNSSTTAGTTLRIANPDIGTVSPTLYRRLVLITSLSTADILLSSAQAFSYIFDATPSTAFSLRVTGYTFRR